MASVAAAVPDLSDFMSLTDEEIHWLQSSPVISAWRYRLPIERAERRRFRERRAEELVVQEKEIWHFVLSTRKKVRRAETDLGHLRPHLSNDGLSSTTTTSSTKHGNAKKASSGKNGSLGIDASRGLLQENEKDDDSYAVKLGPTGAEISELLPPDDGTGILSDWYWMQNMAFSCSDPARWIAETEACVNEFAKA